MFWKVTGCKTNIFRKIGAREGSVGRKHSDCGGRESGRSYSFYTTISV